jgi:hypothetical protein
MDLVEYKEKLLKELLLSVNNLTILIDSKKHPGKSKAVRKAADKTSRDLNRYLNPVPAYMGDALIKAFFAPLPEPQTIFRGFGVFINTGEAKSSDEK